MAESLADPHFAALEAELVQNLEQVSEPQQPQPEAVPQPPQPRRSQRIRKPVYWGWGEDDIYEVYKQEIHLNEVEATLSADNDPKTFREAIEREEAAEWSEAMHAELDSTFKNQVWELVKPQENQKPIGCKWVFKTKRDADGKVERNKARLVATGFTQKEGIDFSETFSPLPLRTHSES